MYTKVKSIFLEKIKCCPLLKKRTWSNRKKPGDQKSITGNIPEPSPSDCRGLNQLEDKLRPQQVEIQLMLERPKKRLTNKRQVLPKGGVKAPAFPNSRESKKHGFIRVAALPKNRNLFCLITINRTKNNTHATISNLFGESKTRWTISAGQFKIPGGRRKTRLSQRMIYKSSLEKALSFGYRFAVIHCKGTRGSKVRIFRFFGGKSPKATALTVLLLKDTTGAAHNGCRPPKVRRV